MQCISEKIGYAHMGAKKTKGFKYDSQNTCRLYGYLKLSFPVHVICDRSR